MTLLVVGKVMKQVPLVFGALLIFLLSGCASYTPKKEDFETNYVVDQIYILQQDVALKDSGFMWNPTIDNPRFYLWADLYDSRLPRIQKGTRIKYKKIIFEDHPTMGPMFDPVGYLLDPPFEGVPVTLTFISQKKEFLENKFGTHGNYLNPEYLKPSKTGINSNQAE